MPWDRREGSPGQEGRRGNIIEAEKSEQTVHVQESIPDRGSSPSCWQLLGVCVFMERCLVGLEFRLTVWLVSKLEALLSMFVKGFNTKPRSLNVLLPSAQRPEKGGTCSALCLKDLQGAMKESLEEVGLHVATEQNIHLTNRGRGRQN